jgi:simple sugar transport system permease protein
MEYLVRKKSKKTRKNEQAEQQDERSLVERIAVRKSRREALLVPFLAILTALFIGCFVIIFADPDVMAAWGDFFSDPLAALAATFQSIFEAYGALFTGAFGRIPQMTRAFQSWQASGDTRPLLDAFRPLGESLVVTTPYIFAGLAVALGFRGGLFNIGAEGQLFVAGIASVFVGYSVTGLPAYIHMPLAILAGLLAGAIWGGIPGILKARTGAHEVINTIMMNYIAFRLTDYLLTGPMLAPGANLPITPDVLPTAEIPSLFSEPMRLHWGFFLALAVAGLVYWFMWKTPLGMEIRMVGANPRAARYAGIRIAWITVLTMALSGALAGMAGVSHLLGVERRLVSAFSSGYGFDAIALALLGNSHPAGVVLASLLFGFLRSGAARMQSVAGTPVELIRIIQALVIVFIAAPEIIRSLFRLNRKRKEKAALEQSSS